MKQVLPLLVFFGMSSAFATQKVCDVTVKTSAGSVTTTEKLQPRVIEGADLASYVMDKNIEGFDVFVMEVDGNYIARMTAGATKVSTEGVDTVNLSATYRNRTLSLSCY